MFYQGEKKKGKAPAELEIYEMALQLGKLPDEIRAMETRDFQMMKAIPLARKLANDEMARRKAEG
jgi:hypothetical protein